MKGKRCIGGGRPKVRVALYMSSLSAIRCNPILRAFYQRLIAKGKPAKSRFDCRDAQTAGLYEPSTQSAGRQTQRRRPKQKLKNKN